MHPEASCRDRLWSDIKPRGLATVHHAPDFGMNTCRLFAFRQFCYRQTEPRQCRFYPCPAPAPFPARPAPAPHQQARLWLGAAGVPMCPAMHAPLSGALGLTGAMDFAEILPRPHPYMHSAHPLKPDRLDHPADQTYQDQGAQHARQRFE